MRNLIIHLQKSGTCKIQLTIVTNFISSKDIDEEPVMQLKSNNTEFKTFDDVNDVVDKFFKSLLLKYQSHLGTSMRRIDFISDSTQLFHYKCHRTNFWPGGSYIDLSDWIKKNKGTIHPKNKDDKCFQYAATVALNYREIKWNPERVSNIKPFINHL